MWIYKTQKKIWEYVLINSIAKRLTRLVQLLFLVFSFSLTYAQQFINKAPQLNVSHSLNNVDNFWGAGVSFFDFDNDGWDDLSLIRVNANSLFYKNVNGTFQPAPFSIFTQGDVKQMIWVDYDNDGDYDLAYCTYSGGSFKLFRNDGNWVFTDVTMSSGLHGLNTQNYGFSFGDYDKDGDLDLYICRYYGQGNPTDPMLTNALFRNNGDGTFTNVTVEAGVSNGIATSFIGIWIDYDDDTWPDLYLINDRTPFPNVLYRNNGNGTFTDVTLQTNTAMIQPTGHADEPMSATFADFDNDGDLDIYSSNTGSSVSEARLLVNQNGVNFTEEAVSRGVNLDQWSWGATFIDVDNDTWMDLYVTTATISPNTTQEVRSYLYMSNQGQTFTDSPHLFLSQNHVAPSYSVAKGDVNNDGFADMIVVNGKGHPSFLWANTASSTNNYVKITLEGTISNRMAIGSWIKLYVDDKVFSHYTRCGENYCSQNSQHHIFGMGQYNTIDSIIVTYLSGINDKYYNVDVNQHLYLTEGETLLFAIDNNGLSHLCHGTELTLSAPNFDVFAWSTGDSTQTITINEAGVYYLSAWNAAGHHYHSDTIEIIALDPIVINSSVNHVSCHGLNDGVISLDLQTQATTYEVNWSHGTTGLVVESLGPGNYAFSYSDEYGCLMTDEVFIFEPEAISLFTQITPQDNHALGSLQLFAVGGEPPYQFFIDGQAATEFSSLASGTYEVQVVDATGCVYSTSVVIPFDEGLGLDQPELHEAWLFPNPLGQPHLLQIQFSGEQVLSNVHVFDASGRRVLSQTNTQNDKNMQLDLRHLARGFYTVALQSKEHVEFHKLQITQ